MRVTRKAGKVEALRQAIKGLDGAQGRVGWFPSAVYEGGQPVAGIAHVQEFGSPSRGIYPRPFFRNTAEERAPEWRKTAENISRAAARGEVEPSAVMEALAMAAEGHVREAITKVTSPALKEATVAARKRRLANKGENVRPTRHPKKPAIMGIDKPLVDSGILLNTLTSETE